MKMKKTGELTEDQREIARLKRSITDLQDQLIRANGKALTAQIN